MTSTCTSEEIKELKKILGLRDMNTVDLLAHPVQSHFNFVRIERPPTIRGVSGTEEYGGKLKPGLIQLLKRVFFDKYAENIKLGLPVKKSLWLCRNASDVADLYNELCEMLPDQAANPSTCPYVMNHSAIGPITAKTIHSRSDISLFLSTLVMLLGLDLDDIDIIVMFRPFNHCHDILQAAGRGGRKLQIDGKRRKVVFSLCYNKSDISNTVPGMSESVKEFCETKQCLKSFLRCEFGGPELCEYSSKVWCCSNCC